MKIVKYTIVIIFFLAGIGSCQEKDKGCDANYSNLDSIKVISYTNFIHSKNLYTIVDSNCLSKISELLCEENKMELIKIPPTTILLVYYNNSTDTLIIHSNVVKRKGTTWVYKNNIESKINSYIATSKWNQKRVMGTSTHGVRNDVHFIENLIRMEHGVSLRSHYGVTTSGKPFEPSRIIDKEGNLFNFRPFSY